MATEEGDNNKKKKTRAKAKAKTTKNEQLEKITFEILTVYGEEFGDIISRIDKPETIILNNTNRIYNHVIAHTHIMLKLTQKPDQHKFISDILKNLLEIGRLTTEESVRNDPLNENVEVVYHEGNLSTPGAYHCSLLSDYIYQHCNFGNANSRDRSLSTVDCTNLSLVNALISLVCFKNYLLSTHETKDVSLESFTDAMGALQNCLLSVHEASWFYELGLYVSHDIKLIKNYEKKVREVKNQKYEEWLKEHNNWLSDKEVKAAVDKKPYFEKLHIKAAELYKKYNDLRFGMLSRKECAKLLDFQHEIYAYMDELRKEALLVDEIENVFGKKNDRGITTLRDWIVRGEKILNSK